MILGGAICVGGVAALIALQPAGTPLDWGIRAAAMLGLLAVFLTAISSVYMRELYHLLGRPFIKVHHGVAIVGLVLITLHPIGVAIRSSDPLVFIPDLASVRAFFALGGRPAWYLFGVASLAALFRTTIRRRWRVIHLLNYVGFWLATVHALMLGTDFRRPVMTTVGVALALALAGAFVHKRLQRWRVGSRRQG